MDQTESARQNELILLASSVRTRAASDRGFRRAVGSLAEDLDYISDCLGKDPKAWRHNRSFHVVHVPSLANVIAVLGQIDTMTSISDDELHGLHQNIHRAAQLACTARARLEARILSAARVELETLAEYAPKPETTLGKASYFTRAADGMATATSRTWAHMKAGAEALPAVASKTGAGVSDGLNRAAAAGALAANLGKVMGGVLSDNVSKPIEMRLNAGNKALRSGVGTGVGLGVLTGILFPPLLPLSAGGAVLVAMQTWKKDMDAAARLQAKERAARMEALAVERKAALARLTQGAEAAQFETDTLNLTVDAETGTADAVILDGAYEGRMWSSLSAPEKAALSANLVSAGAEVLAGILNLSSDF